MNPCGFWAGKHASSSFRELRVSRGMQHFVLWASVSPTQPALSCWSLPVADFGPDWSLLDGNQGKDTWISVLKQQGENTSFGADPLGKCRARLSVSPHVGSSPSGGGSPSFNFLGLPDVGGDFPKARNLCIYTASRRRRLLIADLTVNCPVC